MDLETQTPLVRDHKSDRGLKRSGKESVDPENQCTELFRQGRRDLKTGRFKKIIIILSSNSPSRAGVRRKPDIVNHNTGRAGGRRFQTSLVHIVRSHLIKQIH